MNASSPRARFLAAAVLAAGSLLGAGAAVADPSSATAPPRLIRLPDGSFTVPLRELAGSGTYGTASFQPNGMKTLVTMHVYGPTGRRYNLVLHRGQDCTTLPAEAIPLRPAVAGEPTQTLIAIPLNNLGGNYVIDARDATERNQYAEACGKL